MRRSLALQWLVGSSAFVVGFGCGNGSTTDDEVGDTVGTTEADASTVAEGESASDSGTGSETGSTTTTDTTDTTTTDTSDTTDTSTTDATDTSSKSDTTDTTDTGTSETTDGCMATEIVEVTCDLVDNDCDDVVDNVDVGNDGICDCLSIGIIGNTGYNPSANFEAWLEDQGTVVQRTLLANNPGVVTPAFLAQYDLLLVDRIERSLSPEEAAAIAAFVKDDGRGVITLIGYNFDNNNPGPERDRANTVLAPFGLAYQGGYIHVNGGVIPTFDQVHPVSMGIFDVNLAGGMVPVDNGNQGSSTIFATVPQGNAGLAHQTAMMDGGRVVVWGDEWITFDSDWLGYADVQDFWVNLVNWAKPQDFCGSPQ